MGLKTGARPARSARSRLTSSSSQSRSKRSAATTTTTTSAKQRAHTADVNTAPTHALPAPTSSFTLSSHSPSINASRRAFKGFIPLLVQLLPSASAVTSAASTTSTPVRCLFYRAHHPSGEDDDVPAERTLFVVNVPFLYTAAELSALFACFGDVDSAVILSSSLTLTAAAAETAVSSPSDIFIAPRPHPFYHSARVIYASARSVQLALSTDLSGAVQPSPPTPSAYVPLLRFLHLSYRASLPDVPAFRASIDRFMAAFDAERREEDRRRATGESEDGWTVVRRKRGRAADADAMEEIRRRAEKKRATTSNVDFYRFARREERARVVDDLKKRFDEDKRKVAQFKAARHFNPV